ncbi:DinB family protein [Actinokineospora inagensis]|uniref:DinB family protein n=1 Tax=Actinokineospora inagensis TaxID=103730 RepID=UPI0003F6F0E0|nr:DinB family protein [Actinokineospora inagensis]
MPRTPVTPDDLDAAVRLATTTFHDVSPEQWERAAADSEWTCWEVVEHVADCLFYYAAQISTRVPPTGAVPFSWAPRRPDGPENIVFADPSAGTAGLLQVLEACGAMLSSLATTARPSGLAHHTYGASDPEGFAAMGVVETLVHGLDIALACDLPWAPPDDLCDRILARLFPYAPDEVGGWQALLWCAGRIDLPGRPRLTKWQWNGTPVD